MVSFTVETDSSVDEKKVEKRLVMALESVVRSGEVEATQEVPVDTGRLKNSIKTLRLDKYTRALVANAEYAAAVEKGTDPHTINPTDADALFWEGASHPVMSVQHPGTPAQPFMQPALDYMRSIAGDKFDFYLSGKV